LQQAASARVPVATVSATIQAATLLAAGHAGTAGLISAEVAALTKGVLQTMLLTNLKRAALVVLTIGVLLAGAAVSTHVLTAEPAATGQVKGPGPATPKDAPEPPRAGDPEARQPGDRLPKDSRLQALLKDRLAAVQELANGVKELQKRGLASQGAVRQAELRVFKAELELCETDKERVAVHEKIVGVFRDIENQIARLRKQATASETEVLEAKVNRLEAEIALERARAKVAP
jgi:hypothetical protein